MDARPHDRSTPDEGRQRPKRQGFRRQEDVGHEERDRRAMRRWHAVCLLDFRCSSYGNDGSLLTNDLFQALGRRVERQGADDKVADMSGSCVEKGEGCCAGHDDVRLCFGSDRSVKSALWYVLKSTALAWSKNQEIQPMIKGSDSRTKTECYPTRRQSKLPELP